ncbi:MAG TPA: PhnD/SsuA/transferrin family substrate-binding protein [Stellaceae bacterium]|jgi:ABC-type phosphate/phosphonate transport system substrate-binding protein|nr:PhnD/SsuA/transferrin family substrate-binding protein [Stellaceae bacterium]
MAAIAQLPMYDLPEIRPASDALWAAIAVRLRAAGLADVPVALARELDHHQAWGHPELLFAQSCGYPALHDYRARLRIVAAPIHDAPGCSGATYCSFLLVAAASPAQTIADLRGRRFALNSWDSNTGMNLARLAFAPYATAGRFLGQIVETGGHAASLASLAQGETDVTAIDCVSYALLARHRPALAAATRILARTAPSPTLPFVTARAQPPATIRMLRDALAEALADPALAASRAALFLTGMAPADAADYGILFDYRDRAANLGYPLLA